MSSQYLVSSRNMRESALLYMILAVYSANIRQAFSVLYVDQLFHHVVSSSDKKIRAENKMCTVSLAFLISCMLFAVLHQEMMSFIHGPYQLQYCAHE